MLRLQEILVKSTLFFCGERTKAKSVILDEGVEATDRWALDTTYWVWLPESKSQRYLATIYDRPPQHFVIDF